MIKKSIILSAIALSVLMTQPALAGSPKGKPFIEIQGQIVEVKGDITSITADLDAAVARIETVEGKVSYLENQVIELQAKDTALTTAINDLALQAYNNSLDIQALFDQSAAIEDQIEALRLDVDANGILSQYNADEIVRLESELKANKDLIATNIDGISSLIAELGDVNDLIDGIEEDIILLEADLADKQNIITGSCYGLSAIKSIEADGTVNCETTNEHEYVLTSIINQNKYVTVPGRTRTWEYWYCNISIFGSCRDRRYHWVYGPVVYGSISLYCPNNADSRFVRLSSYYNNYGLVVTSQSALGDNGYYVSLRNDTSDTRGFRLYNSCIGSSVSVPVL